MYYKLSAILPASAILRNEPMSGHTTFEFGGPADYFLIPQNTAQLAQLLVLAQSENIPCLVIGNGSNLLVKDGGIRGFVIVTSALQACVVQENIIKAEAGITLEKLAQIALAHSLSGMEFASGIPGSLGGAVFMNAGAYDGEMSQIISASTYLDYAGKSHNLAATEHQFAYRKSIYQQMQAIIVDATIHLKAGNQAQIEQKMNDLHELRWSKQPMDKPSGGSVFKRPEGYFVGKLLSDCGLRGFHIGGAEISEKHCGFIINRGNATARDVLDVIAEAQKSVWERFKVRLEPELRVIGSD
jgi:UDP-N-acetylmuramate dehydrogenase